MKIVEVWMFLCVLGVINCAPITGRLFKNFDHSITQQTFSCLRRRGVGLVRLNSWYYGWNQWLKTDHENAKSSGLDVIEAQIWLSPTFEGNEPAALPASIIVQNIQELDIPILWIAVDDLGYWYEDIQLNRQYFRNFIHVLRASNRFLGISSNRNIWAKLFGEATWTDNTFGDFYISYEGSDSFSNFSDWATFAGFSIPDEKLLMNTQIDCNEKSILTWHA